MTCPHGFVSEIACTHCTPADAFEVSYDVQCARCGVTLPVVDAIPEEGDEWECAPCNAFQNALERDERVAALHDATIGALPYPLPVPPPALFTPEQIRALEMMYPPPGWNAELSSPDHGEFVYVVGSPDDRA